MKTIFAVLLLAVVNPLSASEVRTWNFDVLLDDSRIGSHRFEVMPVGEGLRVTSDARFDVRFLFFNAFRYRHSNTELWQDDCLSEFSSQTRMNRERIEVTGTSGTNGLVVNDGERTSELDACVMSFAYWNPEFLQQERLLNPQDGRYLDVNVDELPSQVISVRGEDVDARVYRIRAEKVQVTLWYSSDDEWLALESVAKGGRILRYELS